MYTYLIDFIKRPILKEISWYSIGQIGVQFFTFLGVMVTARYLGPVNLGLYSFVQNYLGIFMTFSSGIDFYFTWKIAKSDNKIDFLKEAIGYKFCINIFISFIGILFAWLILPNDVAVLITILFTPLFLGSTNSFYSYAIANKRANLVAVIQVSSAFFLFLIKITLVYIKAPLTAFVATNALEGILFIVIITVYFLRQNETRLIFRRKSLPTFWKTLQFVISVRMNILLLVLWQLIARVDQLVIATIFSAYSLGIYSSAVRIAEVPNVFSGILYTAFVSRIVLLEKENTELSKKGFKKVFLVYLLSGLFFTLIIIIFAPLLVSILYGAKFIEAVPVLRAYAFSIPGSFILTHSFSLYGVREKPTQQIIIFSCGVVLNVGLIYLLVPHFGLVGAAGATSIAYAIIAFIFFMYTK